jgi:penicillin-binding protein 2
VDTTSVPDSKDAARAFLAAWQAEDYAAMYAMLTPLSKDAISAADFEKFYRGVAADGAVAGMDYEILSVLTNPTRAQVSYRVHLHSVLVGDIQRDTLVNLALEDGEWLVQWEEGVVLPELAGGNYFSMDVRVPSRGNIYDRDGHALVAQADAVALGLDTGQVDLDQQESLLNELWRLTGIRPETIRPTLENYRQFGWYMPIGEVPADVVAARDSILASYSGLVMQSFRSRYYFDSIAPHVVGYVSFITAEEEEEYRRKGYRVDEKVGRAGLEAWGEDYLSGTRGGALYVVNPDGAIVTKLAESEPEPAYSIYTTLDKDLQLQAQQAIAGFRGAIVVMERDTGRVLALVSSPGFDPNLFEPSNFNSSFQLGEIFSNEDIPLLNRATQGQYPLGSVFKLITMSAAYETGLYDLEKTYDCGSAFTEIPGFTSYDWTFEKELPASGTLTLAEGLMRSCNPFFQHIAYALYNQGQGDLISTMAEEFGLGSATGMIGVEESPGQIPVPGTEIDAVNQAIGQGTMLVNPLQVVDFIAAIGNGGTLFRPQIIERIESPTGEIIQSFTPEERGQLPISEETLDAVRGAMRLVVANPRGTAYHRFPNFPVPIAGKTGSAETGGGRESHAWFAGYTFAEREDKPDIAVVVIVENAGEGSDYGAPIFGRVVEIYFQGKPQRLYWWESTIGVTKTPTPEVTDTPTPEPTPE